MLVLNHAFRLVVNPRPVYLGVVAKTYDALQRWASAARAFRRVPLLTRAISCEEPKTRVVLLETSSARVTASFNSSTEGSSSE